MDYLFYLSTEFFFIFYNFVLYIVLPYYALIFIMIYMKIYYYKMN